MQFARLRPGEVVAATAGILLLAAMLLLPWYGGYSALAAFGLLDILLLATAIAAVGAAALALTQRSAALPVAASVVVTALGVLVTLLVLYRILVPPGYDDALEPAVGVFVGLALCAAIALGGFLSLRQEEPGFGSGPPNSSETIPTRPAPRADPSSDRPPPPAEPPG